jgi:hypothetical protein
MKTKRNCIFFFSVLFFTISAQEKKAKTSILTQYKPNIMVGVDVLNAGIGFFSSRKLYQGFVSTELKPKLHIIADAGFEKNEYVKNGYNANVSGGFLKLGTLYMLIADPENKNNGFYVGGKIAGTLYNQHYLSVPVRGFVVGDYSVSYPSSSQSSYWIEGVLGARVQLFGSGFYIDANFQPKYLVYTTKQEELQPLIIPGFGDSTSSFATGFSWSIAYRF